MKQTFRTTAAATALLGMAAAASAQAFQVEYTRVPTNTVFIDSEVRGNTAIRGLNDAGQYVGTFGERNWVIWNMPHAFIHGSNDVGLITGVGSESRSPQGYRLGGIEGPRYADPQARYLDLAPAPAPSDFNVQATVPNAIDNRGVVVGSMSSDEYGQRPAKAFRYDTETRSFSVLSIPGAIAMEAMDINASGQIVGNYQDASHAWHGFLYSGGNYTLIDRPGYANGGTRVRGINDAGTIVGSSDDLGNPNSFILRNGAFEDFKADGRYTVASDINNSEQIVGWVGVSGTRLGFMYQGGSSTILDLSNYGGSTYAYTINNLGVVGGEVDGVGFLATPVTTPVPEPASYALVIAGLAGLLFVAKRRRG